MKKRSLITVLTLLLASVTAQGNTLASPQPAYASPDAQAQILGTAQAGARLATSPAPSGWQAVELAGPHTVYVTEQDTLKNFEVRPGASYFSAPRADAPVIGLAGDKDAAAFADIAGRFNKFSLNKPLIAYVRVAPTAVAALAPAPTPAPTTARSDAPVAFAGTATPTNDYGNTLRNDIPANSPVVAGSGLGAVEPSLARTFFGTVASTRHPLRPRRPFDFQLNDSAGQRIAFLDVSRLLLTEQIEAFIGRPVSLYGTTEIVGVAGEIVVRVETLKLQ